MAPTVKVRSNRRKIDVLGDENKVAARPGRPAGDKRARAHRWTGAGCYSSGL